MDIYKLCDVQLSPRSEPSCLPLLEPCQASYYSLSPPDLLSPPLSTSSQVHNGRLNGL